MPRTVTRGYFLPCTWCRETLLVSAKSIHAAASPDIEPSGTRTVAHDRGPSENDKARNLSFFDEIVKSIPPEILERSKYGPAVDDRHHGFPRNRQSGERAISAF